jgi:transposase-like protein
MKHARAAIAHKGYMEKAMARARALKDVYIQAKRSAAIAKALMEDARILSPYFA